MCIRDRSGINLEDSHVVDSTRRLDDAERFAVKLQEITRACPGLFVNVRTCLLYTSWNSRQPFYLRHFPIQPYAIVRQ